ncbi:hypothetical protein HYX10_04905 [Candidatus Woesearchaeota archaeon]|nr:hypothetical protein [Candidatus Woesearchaeota archaeon]
MSHRIKALLEASREVFLEAALENGAIVAANTDIQHYPKNVANYHYVWPRDVAFTLYAAHLLGINSMRKPFIKWLLERAEGFRETGLVHQRYATNGARDTEFGSQYQPDQAGALLWSLLAQPLDSASKNAVTLLADGLTERWGGSRFNVVAHDLWEERDLKDDIKNSFSYSLAACSFGLRRAHEALNNDKWLRASEQMVAAMQTCPSSFYPRVCSLPDEHVDGSLLGLIWPFNVTNHDTKSKESVLRIEQRLLTPQGVMRYENDVYDGVLSHTRLQNKGAGGWPLLTYWYAIALSKLDRRAEAKLLFEKYSNNFRHFIPEQLHAGTTPSVSPLCWSHSMFVIAAKEFGYLSKTTTTS